MAIKALCIYLLVLCAAIFSLPAVQLASGAGTDSPPRQYGYEVIREFPHDPGAFTQGLVFDQGVVYEGTGLYGRSSLRQVDLRSGRVELLHEHSEKIFAEGIAVLDDRIYQLSWKNRVLFEFHRDDFSLRRSWPYARDGWGLTHDGTYLIASDGSSSLYFLNPATMEDERVIEVHDQSRPLSQLNELEYIDGRIFANIYQQDRIAIIDPDDGRVRGYLDLSGLSARVRAESGGGVLNGIMYDSDNERLFVTGKLWPALFEIKMVE